MTEPNAPLYIGGRQHCGNTLLVTTLARHPAILGSEDECVYFANYTPERLSTREARIDHVLRYIHAHARTGEEAITDPGPTRMHLWRYAEARMEAGEGEPDLDALYREAALAAAALYGKRRLCLKDTSLVFYLDHLWRILPEAKVIFLIRSPLDISASIRVRAGGSGRFLRNALAWSRGTRLARQGQDRYPERLRLLRYEDLIQRPEATLRQICAFIGEDFDPAMLDIRLINPAEVEQGAALEGASGFQSQRIDTYRQHLTLAEAAAVARLLDRTLLATLYPEVMADLAKAKGWRTRLAWLRFVVLGVLHLGLDQLGSLLRDPRATWHRLRSKLGGRKP